MSVEAMRYVKKLLTAPNGDPINVQERCLLWILADSHNEEEGRAWNSVAYLAKYTNLSERQVRQHLRELIDKDIIWREDRYDPEQQNRQTSNFWRFSAVDGPPSATQQRREQERRIKGEIYRQRRADLNPAPDDSHISTDIHVVPLQNSAPTPCTEPLPSPAAGCTPDPAAERTPLPAVDRSRKLINTETLVETTANPHRKPQATAAVENSGAAEGWATILEKLHRLAGEAPKDRALVKALRTYTRGEQHGDRLEVSTESETVLLLLQEVRAPIQSAARDVGIKSVSFKLREAA